MSRPAKELRSTTLAVGAKDDAGGPSGAAVRLLDPDRYRGTMHFAIDVTGATVYVNGTKVAAVAEGRDRAARRHAGGARDAPASITTS